MTYSNLYQIYFEITVSPCSVIGSQRCDLFTIYSSSLQWYLVRSVRLFQFSLTFLQTVNFP